jgi:hypothetical protein
VDGIPRVLSGWWPSTYATYVGVLVHWASELDTVPGDSSVEPDQIEFLLFNKRRSAASA